MIPDDNENIEGAVTGTDSGRVGAKAIETADAHTPVVPDPVETVENPATDGNARLDAIESVLATLGNSVAALTDLVATVVTDKAPRKATPWTHYGNRKTDDD